MMELTCAFILISASLVIATPHGYGGYGVKGGASARAESSASAGAFPGIPVAVPLGAGYSGSFSKSSSSSSASSSASSSSSSFSYSGSGAGGFGVHGGAPGHGGCSSGNCQNAGGNGVHTPHGSSAHGFNSANAAASAEAAAGAVSGSGCQGSSCDENSEKCTSGSCKPGTAAIDSDSKKCTSGQCGSASENDDGSNDIRAVTDSAHNAYHHSSSIDKTSSGHTGVDSNCFNGKCSPSSSKPNHYGQQGSSLDIGINSHYQKPSTHLETPKESSKCSSGNCNAGPGAPGYGSSPSSYNVPIHGDYDKGEPKPSCDGVKCEIQPNGPYSPTDNSVTKGPTPFDYPSSTNCVGSSCFGTPANQVTGGPSGTVRPAYDNYGHTPSHVPVAPGHIGHPKPSDASSKLPNDKLPPYTGGFGGPAGVLSPNDVPVTVNPNHDQPSLANTPQNGKPLGSTLTGCNSPSCSGLPSGSGPTGGLTPTGTYNHHSGGNNPSEKLPPYTGGFGGPAGTLIPSGFDVHAQVTNKPNYAHPGNPSYTTTPAGSVGTPNCQGGNCGGYSPTAGAPSGASASGHYGTTKPSNGINSPNDKLPTYTGGFGAPGGVYNPDKHDIHATGPSSSGHTPTGTYNTPSPSGPSGAAPNHPQYTGGFGGTSGTFKPDEHSSAGCKTGNCDNYPISGPSAGGNAQPGSFDVTKPITDAAPNKPQYTGGFGGPSGTFKPSGHSSPGCNGGNCANYPTNGPSAGGNAQPGSFGVTKPITNAAPNKPQYTGGFGGPSGTFKPSEYSSPGCNGGNCANYPTNGPSAGGNAQPGSFGVTKPITNAAPYKPQYTGGFGGPSGTFKPSEYSSPGCNGGNCENYPTSGPSAGANAQPGSFGVTKPITDAVPNKPQYTGGFGGPSGTLKPSEHGSPGCNGGNCANYPIRGPSAGGNVQPESFGVTKPITDAAPNKPQYTGGFGGPSGTFKPSEHSSPGCNGGNCEDYLTTGPSAGANAQPGSFAVTKPITDTAPNKPQYTGGFGGPSGTFKPSEHGSPGCNGENCANYPISGPSAGAIAQPGSFGVTKPITDVAPKQPQYTGGFGGPSATLNPGGHSYVTPSSGSANCGTPNCFGSPAANAHAAAGAAANAHAAAGAGANAHLGSYGITKPSGSDNPSNEKPNYNGGFGGAAGLLKPNDYTVPAVSPTPINKPSGVSTPPACISGICNPQAPHSSAPHAHNGATGGAHATAAAAAEANAVVYTGGFGGPPGILTPSNDGKIGTLPTLGGQGHGPHIGGAHGYLNANIHSQHGTTPGASGGPTGPARPYGNTDAQAGSTAGAAAYAGAAAGASAGAHGFNPHGSYNHAGNVKGGGPCGGGCGGSGVGGDGGGASVATGKSLSGAFGLGGSFASSSASAHASAGAYTKGGYGKR